MATLAIRDSLLKESHFVGMGGERLQGYEKIPVTQQLRYQVALNALLQKPEVQTAIPSPLTDYQFRVEREGLVLQTSEGGKKLLPMGDLAKEAFFQVYCQMQEYCSAMHLGDRRFYAEPFEDYLRKNLVQCLFERARSERSAEIASETECSKWVTWSKQIPAQMGNVGSVCRNSWSATSVVVAESAAVASLALFGSCMAIISSGYIIRAGNKIHAEASKVDFQEGMNEGNLVRSLGVSLGLLGVDFALSKAPTLGYLSHLSHASQIASYAGMGVAPLYGFFSLLNVITGTYGLAKTSEFYEQCLEYLENPTIADPLTKYRGFTHFLKNELSLSALEIAEIRSKFPPDKQPAEMEKALGRKRLQFEKRTNPELAEKVAGSVDSLLQRLEGTNPSQEALQEAANLAFEVRKATFKKMVEYALLILVGLVGVSAAIASVILTGGIPCILMAITAAIWIFSDSPWTKNATGELFWWLLHKEQEAERVSVL